MFAHRVMYNRLAAVKVKVQHRYVTTVAVAMIVVAVQCMNIVCHVASILTSSLCSVASSVEAQLLIIPCTPLSKINLNSV